MKELTIEYVISVFKKYPSYDRLGNGRENFIAKELGYRWTSKNSINKIRYIIENDTKDYFHLNCILKHQWPIDSTIEFLNKKYFNLDEEKDNIIQNLISGGKYISFIKHFRNHYNIHTDTYLYLKKVDNDKLTEYRKFGLSKRIEKRNVEQSKILPFPFITIGLWEIEFEKRDLVENLIKRKIHSFNVTSKIPYNKHTGEWFIDPNDELLDIINKELEIISKEYNIHIVKK